MKVLLALLVLLVAVATAADTPFLRGRQLEGFAEEKFADMNDQYDDEMYATDVDGMGDGAYDDDAWDADDDEALEELMEGNEWDADADDDEVAGDEYDDDADFADDMLVEEELDDAELLWDGAEEEQYVDGYEEGA